MKILGDAQYSSAQGRPQQVFGSFDDDSSLILGDAQYSSAQGRPQQDSGSTEGDSSLQE